MDAINETWVALRNFERHYEGEHIILEIGDEFSVEQITVFPNNKPQHSLGRGTMIYRYL